MYATVVFVIYLLVRGSLQQSQSMQPRTLANDRNYQQSTNIDPNATEVFHSSDNSFHGQKYHRSGRTQSQNQQRHDGDTNKNQWEQNTTMKPQPTTDYVPHTLDYPISGGEPLSTSTFSDVYDEFPSKDGIEQTVSLEGTEALKDEINRSTDFTNNNQTNIVTIDHTWKPETVTKNKDNGRLSWQVSVFSKEEQPFLRVCGASMLSRVTVISAAHCFWKEGEGLLPASQFAVGAGKVLTHRFDDYGSYQQKNDVETIKVPPTFNGVATNFQHDIAVVHLATAFYAASGMRPVCISFDDDLEKGQLKPGNIATTLGVGVLQKGNLTELQTLKVPYVSSEDCKRSLAKNTLQHFTEDKICAGFKPGTSPVLGEICTRDAGAGLAFHLGNNQDLAKGIAVPFLRGVASRSQPCDASQRTLYTNVRTHRVFLEGNIQDVVEECGKYYPQLGSLLTSNERQFVCDCYC